ncbi:hypothetical protein GCM10009677_31210 [Sphaerisporangium rubeum]
MRAYSVGQDLHRDVRKLGHIGEPSKLFSHDRRSSDTPSDGRLIEYGPELKWVLGSRDGLLTSHAQAVPEWAGELGTVACGGRGLRLVDAVSACWGVTVGHRRTVTWVEVAANSSGVQS